MKKTAGKKNYIDRLYEKADCHARYQVAHRDAIQLGTDVEAPIVNMLRGWLTYADTYRNRFESEIGDDGFLGKEWQCIGYALLVLLNGECGRLDCGTLDHLIRQACVDAHCPLE